MGSCMGRRLGSGAKVGAWALAQLQRRGVSLSGIKGLARERGKTPAVPETSDGISPLLYQCDPSLSLLRTSGSWQIHAHSCPHLTTSDAAGLAPAARSARKASRWPYEAAQ